MAEDVSPGLVRIQKANWGGSPESCVCTYVCFWFHSQNILKTHVCYNISSFVTADGSPTVQNRSLFDHLPVSLG